MLPNLIVIGAAKCGTTSLHGYLGLHPEIAMSRQKELNFFVSEDRWRSGNWHRGLAWYESHFDPSAPVRGETSPFYTTPASMVGVPERMAATIPGAKLIYLVRDPLDRIVSSYRYLRFAMRSEERTLVEAVHDPESPYLVNCSYALFLSRYLEHFPAEQILVVDLAELAQARATTLQGIFRFLGVDDRFTTDEFDQVQNRTDEIVRNGVGLAAYRTLNRFLSTNRSRAVRGLAPVWATRFLYQSSSSVPRVEVGPELRAVLVERLKPDADRLRALTGMAFASWSV